MQVQPYLFFDGNCAEAVEFYKKALGAKVNALMRYKDSPEPPRADCKPPNENAVMHASFNVGDTMIMASDDPTGHPKFGGFSLSLAARDEADAQRLFNALANGGTVQQPLTKTFFSPSFGMVADRFGVSWMVLVPQEMPAKH